MFLDPAYTDRDLPTLYQFIRENPLGIITTAIKSSKYPTIQSSHIPWILEVHPEDSSSDGPKAKLRGHMARINPQVKNLIDVAKETSSNTIQEDVMILFNGIHHYVTPKFYVETKPKTGKTVPTWNYTAVQIYGTATIHYDPASPDTDAFLSKALVDLSKQSEEGIMGYTGKDGAEKPWTVDEAPESYTNALKKAIIGVEIEIKSIVGKFKMSQDKKDGDKKGVIEGFKNLNSDIGNEMANMISERGGLGKIEIQKDRCPHMSLKTRQSSNSMWVMSLLVICLAILFGLFYSK